MSQFRVNLSFSMNSTCQKANEKICILNRNRIIGFENTDEYTAKVDYTIMRIVLYSPSGNDKYLFLFFYNKLNGLQCKTSFFQFYNFLENQDFV